MDHPELSRLVRNFMSLFLVYFSNKHLYFLFFLNSVKLLAAKIWKYIVNIF